MSQAADPLFLSFQLAVAGRYSIDRELGRGGMGIVYLAREVHLDRLVAIKLLPPDKAADELLRERFLREARLAAKLSHPNIIPIHSVEERDGFVYFVMSFIDGETLTERVRARGPLSNKDGAFILLQVSWALAYAHAQGVIHRDVKPDNILLEAASGRALVADFGIAAVAAEGAVASSSSTPLAKGLTSPGAIAGTPEFMSPEQSLGEPLDARSDLYSLGATAFYMFSGRFPFEGRTATEILAKHVTEPAPPLAAQGRAVPRKVAAIVDRCLAKEPAERPASAQAIGEQLGLALEQRRELPAVLRSFVKRERLNGAGTVVAGLALLPLSTYVSFKLGVIAGWTSIAVGALGAPFIYLAFAARRLITQGFDHADVGPAYKAEVEQAREELGGGLAQSESRIEVGLRRAAKIAWPAFGGTIALLVMREVLGQALAGIAPKSALWSMWGVTGYVLDMALPITGIAAIVSLVGWMIVGGRRRDLDTEFWSRFWMGRIGKTVFSIARRLVGNAPRRVAMTHRATELSLGMAADQLYQTLPTGVRGELASLPDVLKRLQDDAQALRQRHDQIQEALNDAGDAATGDSYADVRATRDAVHAKLGETVGALETIRLNLLRLHAGSVSVASVTTHLKAAAEMSRHVDRLVSAQDDVERSLKFPRPAAATPV